MYELADMHDIYAERLDLLTSLTLVQVCAAMFILTTWVCLFWYIAYALQLAG